MDTRKENMSMFTLAVAAFFGLVCIGSIILLVVVIVISRKEDFVNPFSMKKSEPSTEGDEFFAGESD